MADERVIGVGNSCPTDQSAEHGNGCVWYCGNMLKAWLDTLHTGAQWYIIPVTKRSTVQKLAYRTKGVITPANAASVIGFLLVAIGLWFLLNDSALAGAIVIALGRGCDLLDGFLARRTRTASPFGEGLDAALDKVSVLMACLVFAVMGIVPLAFLLFLFFEQTVTAATTLAARQRGYTVHPTKRGKHATFLVWTGAVGFTVAYVLEGSSAWPLLFTASALIMAVGILMAASALVAYLIAIRAHSLLKVPKVPQHPPTRKNT